MRHYTLALTGAILALPFVLLNLAMANQVEPVMSFLRPYGQSTLTEQLLLFGTLFLIFMGGVIALSPVLQENAKGVRKFRILNAIVGVLLIVFSGVLLSVFVEEVYRCDVLQVQHCN